MSLAGTTREDRDVRLPRATQVKNKRPADKQVTAEQLLRESKELQLEETGFKAPRQVITDPEELAEYRLTKRKEFEDLLRRTGRFSPNTWVKYAQWEEAQKDFRRARSVWERALQVNYRNVSYWLKYAEMEMRHRFINHARNVWDRAVSLLPRVDQLWYKYIHMEEMLGNVPGARQIYERWMQFEPDHQGWMAYIKMELRYDEIERGRSIFERYVRCLPTVKAWVRYAKFEMKNGDVSRARRCYERAVVELGEDGQTEDLYLRFAEFEEHVKEIERARAIFQYALDHIPKHQAQDLYQRFVAFEKQHGNREGIEEVISSKRRFQYEEEVGKNPMGYDAWFDYLRLEEAMGDIARTRDVYERAIANTPTDSAKRYWQRYIYLWIGYAVFEELDAQDVERAREVYRTCLKLIPHASFTFAKIWIMAAHFEIRQKRLDAARKILGMAIGMAPKAKVFRAYIEIELSLGNMERVRTIYNKFLDWNPAYCNAWIEYARMEAQLGEMQRVRGLYELAIKQPVLDMPEALWKAYIDFEMSQGERELTRKLYERLLHRTQHVKVWMSYARFEATSAALLGDAAPAEDDEPEDEQAREERRKAALAAETSSQAQERVTKARGVYARAFRSLRESQPDAKEEACMLLEAWRKFEAMDNTADDDEAKQRAIEAIDKKMPRRVKRKRPILTDDGLEAGLEEYYDYIFPEEGAAQPNLKLLDAAYRWKRQKQQQQQQQQ